MFKSSILRACALVTAANMLCAAVCKAGLFDGLKPKTRPAVNETRRAQSPAYDSTAGTWQQPSAPAASGTWHGSAYPSADPSCYCCGPEDKCGRATMQCRKKCDQTYYYPVPPYCFPCYGFNPTCWRQMPECWVCPREQPPQSPPKARRSAPKAEPKAPAAVPQMPPVPMDDPSMTRHRLNSRRVMPVSSRQPAGRPAARSRWTGYADALPDYAEVAEVPVETIEEMIEAEDEAAAEAADEADATEAEEVSEAADES